MIGARSTISARAAIADEPDSRVNLYDLSGHIVLTTIVPFWHRSDQRRVRPTRSVHVVNTKQPYYPTFSLVPSANPVMLS